MTATSTNDFPLGTPPEYARMHTIIRRVCYVLLFALVVEGALTFPLLAIWYGWPELSANEVCSGLQKVAYSDGKRKCEQPVPLDHAPFPGGSEGEGQKTSEDRWGVQPKPEYPSIRYRDLVKWHKQCETWRDTGHRGPAPNDYCD